jgi:hypothetical protein
LFTLSSSRRIQALVLKRAVDETYSRMLPLVAFLQHRQNSGNKHNCCQEREYRSVAAAAHVV